MYFCILINSEAQSWSQNESRSVCVYEKRIFVFCHKRQCLFLGFFVLPNSDGSSTSRMLAPPGRRARPPSSYGSMRTVSSSGSDIMELGVVDDGRPTADAGSSLAVPPNFTHEKPAAAPDENRYRLISLPTPAWCWKLLVSLTLGALWHHFCLCQYQVVVPFTTHSLFYFIGLYWIG